MIKKVAFGAMFAFALAGAVQAQDTIMDCTEIGMTKMQSQIDAMTNEDQKKMAMIDLEKARTAMQAKDMNDCKAHMEKAMKAVMQG